MVIKIFQTNLNLVWNLRLAKSIFLFPNQTGIGLENRTQFLGVTFPNQTGFGLEKDTEENVAALQGAVASWLMVSTKIFWVVLPWSIKKAVGKGRLSGWGEIVGVFHESCKAALD